MGWTDEQKSQVIDLCERFNGTEEVAAVMGCRPDDLDTLCLDGFGTPFEDFRARHAAVGRAKLRDAIWSEAIGGDMRALDMLARDQLGMGAVEARRRNIDAEAAKPDGNGPEVTPLAVIMGKAEARRAGTARERGAKAV